MLSMMALLAVSCSDELEVGGETTEQEKHTGELVFFSSGTTENAASTRANSYYMEPGSRFVCQMYFQTDASGELYDMNRVQTAWLEVENWRNVEKSTPGNSLYWNKVYDRASKFDNFRNDENASMVFYWQNRKKHAFVAWTDYNRISTIVGNDGNGSGGDSYLNFHYPEDEEYPEKTSEKELKWIQYNLVAPGVTQAFTSSSAFALYVKNHATDFVGGANNLQYQQISQFTDLSDPDVWYKFYSDQRFGPKDGKNLQVKVHDYEDTDETHRHRWVVVSYFGSEKRIEYAIPDNTLLPVTVDDDTYYQSKDGYVARKDNETFYQCYATGEFVLDDNQKKVAFTLPDETKILSIDSAIPSYVYYVDGDTPVAVLDSEDNKLYACDEYRYVLYDETTPTLMACAKDPEVKEEVDKYINHKAKRFDLSSTGKSSMAQQPDILVACEPDHVPTSAVMEANRVHLYFKHQFAQVQINLKNAEDNSVQISHTQIDKVELLGVTDYGYVFPYLYYDETSEKPDEPKLRPATFQEVVVAEDQQDENPYGTTFNMFDRTDRLTDDDKNINKIIKSYEGITFGRMQAIRITWHETDAEGGIEHVSTYRVPEKNDMNQNLRLLESGTKYIWNMELRRGTLAVVRTEIIPWEVNQEYYSVDGSIVPTVTPAS